MCNVSAKARRGDFADVQLGDAQLPLVPDIAGNKGSFDLLRFDVEPGDALVFHGNVLHGADGKADYALGRRAFASLWGGPQLRYHRSEGKTFPPPGGEPLSEQIASDRHGYAMLILAVFAILSVTIAIFTGQRVAALATAGFSASLWLGVIAAALEGLNEGNLVELNVKPKLVATARFAYLTLAGRTEAPAMAYFRAFVRDHLHD